MPKSENEHTPAKRSRPQQNGHDGNNGTGSQDSDSQGQLSGDSQPSLSGSQQVQDRQQWTVDQVEENLREAGFSKDVTSKFREKEIDGSMLYSLTKHQLKQMGIKVGTVQRILKFLERTGCFDAKVMYPAGSKVFNDPVHGHMEFHPLLVAIIDTPQFQRLRFLKQLEACYYVFSGAAHNRFEHSLGVCHLAGQLVRTIQKRQPELHITDVDVLCVQVAGLCHDLGHGPFSHMFEFNFIPAVRTDLKDKPWEHKDASLKMFQLMVDKLGARFERYGLAEHDYVFIVEQITGRPLESSSSSSSSSENKDWPYLGRPPEKAFLYQIMTSKECGINVDQWDCSKRDCYHLGMRMSFDHTGLIHFARVMGVQEKTTDCGQQKDLHLMQICICKEGELDVHELSHMRLALHQRVYQDDKVQSVEKMLLEAMILADEWIRIPGKDGKKYKMSECIDHMDAYTNLTDEVFQMILVSSSQEEDVIEAKKILHKIARRKLYKCFGKIVLTRDNLSGDEREIKAAILNNLSEEQREKCELNEDRVKIQLDLGMKNIESPFDQLRFYSKDCVNSAGLEREASQMPDTVTPQEQFGEQHVQVRLYFVPSDEDDGKDEERLLELSRAFKAWCESITELASQPESSLVHGNHGGSVPR